MDAGTQKGRMRSEINVTPLVDIVLVLLIVFIVLVPGLTKVLAVNIPIDRGEKGIPPQPPVVVTLDERGRLLLQKEEIPLAVLADRLAPVVQLQPMGLRKIFLKVDQDIVQQRIIQVLDQVQVASERARIETGVRRGNKEDDGGDVKVAVTLLKRA